MFSLHGGLIETTLCFASYDYFRMSIVQEITVNKVYLYINQPIYIIDHFLYVTKILNNENVST